MVAQIVERTRPAGTDGTAGGVVTSTRDPLSAIESSLYALARALTQVRLHERLITEAHIGIDRAGAALLHKLQSCGDELRLCDVADRLGVDAPFVTRKVQRLERDGYVVRTKDATDRRAARLRLTSKGRRTIERLHAARRSWLEELVAGFSPAERATLARLLGRLADKLDPFEEVHCGG